MLRPWLALPVAALTRRVERAHQLVDIRWDWFTIPHFSHSLPCDSKGLRYTPVRGAKPRARRCSISYRQRTKWQKSATIPPSDIAKLRGLPGVLPLLRLKLFSLLHP